MTSRNLPVGSSVVTMALVGLWLPSMCSETLKQQTTVTNSVKLNLSPIKSFRAVHIMDAWRSEDVVLAQCDVLSLRPITEVWHHNKRSCHVQMSNMDLCG